VLGWCFDAVDETRTAPPGVQTDLMSDEKTQVAPGLWRTDLQRYDLSIPGREVIQSRVYVEPGFPPLRHFHPGEEVIYVLEGQLEYEVEGLPTKVYGPGEVLTVPAGAVHSVRNVGTTEGSELATYIVEKGKKLLTVVE
jgi:quercetin dioxygenase-like cupin family protein